MELYTLLREFADSWVLLIMTGFFLGAILFAWRPGSRALQAEAAATVFRNDEAPLDDEPASERATAKLDSEVLS